MAVTIALLFGLAWLAVHQAAVLARTITYRVTMRDFISGGCMPGATYPSIIDQYWKSTYNPNTIVNNPRRINQAAFCPIRQDIIDGLYSGHPDFEADVNAYADGCPGSVAALTADPTLPRFTLTAGSQACAGNNVSRIVENYLEFDESGLPKVVHCNGPFNPKDSSDQRCGWMHGTTYPQPATTGKAMFDLWYRDDAKYNKRVLYRLVLDETSPSVFTFDADLTSTRDPRFRPIDNYTSCLATNERLDCSNGGKLWPRQVLDGNEAYGGSTYDETASNGSRFAYTTELHTYFKFKGDETFDFTGDDDMWLFINERLAMDMGALHPRLSSKINFANPSVQQGLNLVKGHYYALDLFHAERHSDGSNFRIQTSFGLGCNIVDSGRNLYSFNIGTIANDWSLVGGLTWAIVEGNAIRLTDRHQPNSVGSAFVKNQMNVGTGFIIKFSFNASTGGEGFAFVVQRDTLTGLSGGSGGDLGFRNIKGSIAVAFDFCGDRNNATVNCNVRDVRLHYANSPEIGNTPDNTTKRARSILIHPNEVNDNNSHGVEIRYYYDSPPWFEVYIDDDLFLQQRNIDVQQIIGGKDAWIGFTASTGPFASTGSDILIYNLDVRTIAIEDSNTQPVGLQLATPVVAFADGRESVAFQIQTFDFCLNAVKWGGFGHRARGLLTRIADTVNEELMNTTDNSAEAKVFDLNNGIYNLTFSTTRAGKYSIQMWFGEGCVINNMWITQTTSMCFYASFENVAIFKAGQGLWPIGVVAAIVIVSLIAFIGVIVLLISYRRQGKDDVVSNPGKMGTAVISDMGEEVSPVASNIGIKASTTVTDVDRKSAVTATSFARMATNAIISGTRTSNSNPAHSTHPKKAKSPSFTSSAMSLVSKLAPAPTAVAEMHGTLNKGRPTVMISYQWESQPVAIRVRDYLLSTGRFNVIIDIKGIKGNFLTWMETSVQASDAMILLITPKYERSVNCEKEACRAHALRKTIIPIMLDPTYGGGQWLAMLIAGLMFYDGSTAEALQESLDTIVERELSTLLH